VGRTRDNLLPHRKDKMKIQDRDQSFEWFTGKTGGIKNAIRMNLEQSRFGSGNQARRRVALLRRFVTIRSRIVEYGPPYSYYFFDSVHTFAGVDVPPKRGQFQQPPITSARDSRLFCCGDIVELDLVESGGGWGRIVRLVDSSGRTNDTHWFTKPRQEMFERFPLPEAPVNPQPFREIEVWRNNDGASLEVEFTPAYWCGLNCREISPPSVCFRKLTISSTSGQRPGGYLQFDHSEPYRVQSDLLKIDDFTRCLDEWFIARLWNGRDRPQWNGIAFPGIGGTISSRHFTRPPHEILGESVFYA